jgi:hypothetical protein
MIALLVGLGFFPQFVLGMVGKVVAGVLAVVSAGGSV